MIGWRTARGVSTVPTLLFSLVTVLSKFWAPWPMGSWGEVSCNLSARATIRRGKSLTNAVIGCRRASTHAIGFRTWSHFIVLWCHVFYVPPWLRHFMVAQNLKSELNLHKLRIFFLVFFFWVTQQLSQDTEYITKNVKKMTYSLDTMKNNTFS